MRYISPIHRHRIYRNDGSVAYEFERGELIVGDPTLNTAGNVIVATPIVGNNEGSVQVLYPAGSTDLGKAGLGVTFFAAPPLATGAATATVGVRYEVVTGSVTNGGVTYKQRDIFVATSTTTGGTGTFSVSIPAAFAEINPEQFRNEHFKINHLLRGDEASFSIQGPESITPQSFTYVVP